MAKITIKHKVSALEREVSEREWEGIVSNPLLKDVYTVVKTVADVKKNKPQSENAGEEGSKPNKKA